MDEREGIYLQILAFGLSGLRDAALVGNAQHCAIEAEHLHNLPSLIGEANEKRHDYYWEQERAYYLDRVDRSVAEIDFTLRRYAELWTQLEELRVRRAE